MLWQGRFCNLSLFFFASQGKLNNSQVESVEFPSSTCFQGLPWISMNFLMHPFLPSLHFAEIAYIKRRSHAIGVGADALIQFAQPAHAACALEATKQRYPQIDRKLRLDSHGFSINIARRSMT